MHWFHSGRAGRLACIVAGIAVFVLGDSSYQADRVAGLPYKYGEQPLHESYAGHITVRTWTPPEGPPDSGKAKLFYWYFPAIAPKTADPPLLMWIQGGPGSSSMIGLFTELGPFDLTDDGEFVRRNITWANEYDLLVVDQPAGTGFSSVTPPANLTLDDLYPLARNLPAHIVDAWRAKYPKSVDQYANIVSPMTVEYIVDQAREMINNLTQPAEDWPWFKRPFLSKLVSSLGVRDTEIPRYLTQQWLVNSHFEVNGPIPYEGFVVPAGLDPADPYLVNTGYGHAVDAKSIWQRIGLSDDEKDDFVGGYATNMRAVGKDMWSFMQKFFGMRPELRARDFYILSESYGGKFVPGIATYIKQKNDELVTATATAGGDEAEQAIGLRGVLIGNSLVHPALQVLAHGGIGFAWGLLDADQADIVDLLAFKAASYTLDGELEKGNAMRLLLFDYYRNVTGGVNWYDIRKRNHQYKRTYLSRGLNQQVVRRALHSDDIAYGQDWGVYYHLSKDIMRTTAPLIPHLLERGLDVQLVQGQFDFRDGVAANTLWINEVQWGGRKQYVMADRQHWRLGKELAGYVRSGGNLTHRVILNAGHMAPGDQPMACQDMVDRFVGL
ncbi:hypothetical protein IWW50_004265 [Coemansia erecta]|nr:hypothetical protein IWW50_004265 [Coemansia erecta]